jgi:hypothetical protein
MESPVEKEGRDDGKCFFEIKKTGKCVENVFI